MISFRRQEKKIMNQIVAYISLITLLSKRIEFLSFVGQTKFHNHIKEKVFLVLYIVIFMISFRRQEKKIMNQIVAYIPSILSVTNFVNAIFIFYLVVSFHYIRTLPHFKEFILLQKETEYLTWAMLFLKTN